MGELDGLGVIGIAHLRGGGWGAVRTGLAMLYVRGAVSARDGTVRRSGRVPRGAEPLELALFGALEGELRPRQLADRQWVREAIGDVRRDLIRRGLVRPQRRRVLLPLALVVVPPWLLGRLIEVVSVHIGLLTSVVLVAVACWFLPRRTLAGARALRQLQARYPAPTDSDRVTPDGIGPAVALYGPAALVATMPRFAREAGLTRFGGTDAA
ncbi:TIGR04222 domain-containing membrane protein [Phytohabitans flavus]|uniref:TIGR04222 domain-containing membrane protein n=1 Tax=Phytohabitans flavus TaxID=1076124 RepID=UPI0031E4ED2F